MVIDWTPNPMENALVAEYELEVNKNGEGWTPLKGDIDHSIHRFEYHISDTTPHTLLYRVRAIMLGSRTSGWRTLETPVTIRSLIGTPGLPGLIRLNYNKFDSDIDARGEYNYSAGMSWEEIRTKGGFVTIDHETSEAEDVGDYLSIVRSGDLHGLVRSAQEFIISPIIRVPNYTYEFTNLPTGVTFNAEDFELEASADATPGDYSLNLRATDEYGNVETQTVPIEIPE